MRHRTPEFRPAQAVVRINDDSPSSCKEPDAVAPDLPIGAYPNARATQLAAAPFRVHPSHASASKRSTNCSKRWSILTNSCSVNALIAVSAYSFHDPARMFSTRG